MDDIFKPEGKKRGVNPVFIVGMIVGVLLIGGAIYLLSFKPPMAEQTTKLLEGSYREGSPEFAALNKDIIIATDENTVESPMGLGTVSMFIKGKVRNKGTRNISTLEVNVAVVTQKNEVLREKRILVVPIQQPILGPDQTIPITLTLDGFDRKDDRANIRWKVTAIKADN
ncbi:MAG: hypothetical protein K1X36_14095 [Pyrinomonadaceae bacterium]|nr:hypothetical protein [Pyrinomonadaceae bacterium]